MIKSARDFDKAGGGYYVEAALEMANAIGRGMFSVRDAEVLMDEKYARIDRKDGWRLANAVYDYEANDDPKA